MKTFPINSPILPDLGRYMRYLGRAHERAWLTNFGPLYDELTERLKAFFGVDHLLLVSNGTLALEVAYRALGLQGKVLTTPFSFVATTTSLDYKGLETRFVDVDPLGFNIDPELLAEAEEAAAIVAVHVYGNPCDVEAIEAIGEKRQIPIIYDAAHAFASRIGGQSVLRWGDVSTLSFHATKLFHTVEGGAIIFRDETHYRAARALINFGQEPGGGIRAGGTNGKLSEYHAAVGLVLLDSLDEIIARRAELVAVYRAELDGCVQFQQWHAGSAIVGAYMPIFLEDEAACLALGEALARDGVETKRYFHPSLNTLDKTSSRACCPVSEDIASRVLCLPLYYDLVVEDVRTISERVKAALR